jgi:hypothetical protein
VLLASGSGKAGRLQIQRLTCDSNCLFFATQRNVSAPYLEHESKALLQYRPLIITVSTFIRATTSSGIVICVTQHNVFSSAKPFKPTQMSFSRPTAISHLYSTHSVFRKHDWMGVNAKAIIF